MMSAFPIEEKTFSILNKVDDYIHHSPILYHSCLFGVIAKMGLLITLPLYKAVLMIEHLALGIFNEFNFPNNSSEDKNWYRKVHIRQIFQHLPIEILGAVLGIFYHPIGSLKLLHPYIYHWSQPNRNMSVSELCGTITWGQQQWFKNQSKKTYDNTRVENLVVQAFVHLKTNCPKYAIGYKNGTIIEKGTQMFANNAKIKYLIADQQHATMWFLERLESTWIIESCRIDNHSLSPYSATAECKFSLSHTSTSILESLAQDDIQELADIASQLQKETQELESASPFQEEIA